MGTRVYDPKADTGFITLNPADVLQSIRRNTHTKLRALRFGLVGLDALMIGLSFLLAYNLRFIFPTTAFFDPAGFSTSDFYTVGVYILIPIWLVLFAAFRMYDPTVLFSGHQEYTNAFSACTGGMMVVVLGSYFFPTLIVSRAWLVLAWGGAVFLVFLERFVMRRVVYSLRRRGHFTAPTYIVGANAEGVAIAEQLMSTYAAGVNIIGFLDDTIEPGKEVLPGVVVHGPTSRAEILCARFGVERILVATSGVQREALLDLFQRFVNSQQVSMWLSSGIYEILTTGVKVQDVGSVPLVNVNRVRLNGPNVIMKMVLDYVCASLGLFFLIPVFGILFVIMKFTDPGPFFYPRRVVGVGGREFDAYKIRTMVINSQQVLDELLERDPEARAEYEKYYKLKNDPRITRLGTWLRKTSVDELPQLLNVLRGEMSLVGPRMITMPEVEKYGKWALNLHTVKPGITGLWQTSGRSEITYEERVRLDMRYIRNYSIWLDIQILFQTIPAVLMSKGAY